MNYKLWFAVLGIPVYLLAMSFSLPGPECGNSQEAGASGAGEYGDSTGTCDKASFEVSKKYFGVVELPVYKFGYDISFLHYVFAGFYLYNVVTLLKRPSL